MQKIALVVLLLSLSVFAQDLRVSVDWAVFDGNAENAYLEIYYSFGQADLNYEQRNEEFVGTTLGRLVISKGDEEIENFAWKSETVIPDTAQLSQQKEVIDRMAFVIPIGEFQCQLTLTDLVDNTNVDSTQWMLKTEAPLEAPHLSEIQFASSIRRAGDQKDSPFYKNSLIVEPNPSLIFSYDKPMLFFYAEAYKLSPDALPNGYMLNYYVKDADGNVVDDVKPKSIAKKSVVNPSVEFGHLNIGELKTSSYTLVVEILDAEKNVVTWQQKKFYTLQKEAFQPQGLVVQGATFENSIFSIMDSADVDTEFQMVFYILGKEESIIHRELTDLDGKRHFLFNFWQSKFPTMSVNDNPHRNQYFNLKRIADERYKAFKMPGWLTDRGRVLMVYGEPDDVERYINQPNQHPYEIWFYNQLQGGVQFIFADLEGHKNYRLIHSNLNGEVYDPNYKDILQRGY
jgi:GWxTD domain-containing protein